MIVDRALHNATRAPNAGFGQALGLPRARPPPRTCAASGRSPPRTSTRPDRWLTGHDDGAGRDPAVLQQGRLDRYAEADKGWTDLDGARWPKPFWDMDTAMAGAADPADGDGQRLGSCFIGVPTDGRTPTCARRSASTRTSTRSA